LVVIVVVVVVVVIAVVVVVLVQHRESKLSLDRPAIYFFGQACPLLAAEPLLRHLMLADAMFSIYLTPWASFLRSH
jgi:hypothetical protein